jgi:hypothetical protein
MPPTGADLDAHEAADPGPVATIVYEGTVEKVRTSAEGGYAWLSDPNQGVVRFPAELGPIRRVAGHLMGRVRVEVRFYALPDEVSNDPPD